MSIHDRKVYSVSVPKDTDLFTFLEKNKNNSKFFVESAEFCLYERQSIQEIVDNISDLRKEIKEEINRLIRSIENGVTSPVIKQGIGKENRPLMSRGRRSEQ